MNNWRDIIRDEHGRTKIGSMPDIAAAALLTVGWVKANLAKMLEQGDPVPDDVIEAAKAAHPSNPAPSTQQTQEGTPCSPSSPPPPD